jgi:predicted NAD/FAD-dependent oxidoreductase
MSAYLHFGCASPFQLAREAALIGGEGAEKYLDELLVWRELAWHFCHHTPDVDALAALPRWAQATLQAHARDPREVTFDWEALARARTGDPLWDTAQRSLLRHGELHNNARMTWGKALLGWTRSPEEALRLLVDLNHRYALDGRDPASYGGLLWCLGLFDRPFSPEEPIYGSLRPRPTAAHARRLEVARWRRLVDRPSLGDPPDVAVIGAGIAGLACARALEDHGLRVTVFDKGRGPGGRVATRRADSGAFDHGAQFLRARDPHFARHVASWEARGLLSRWPCSLAALAPGEAPSPLPDEAPSWAPSPGMSALARHLAAELRALRLSTRVGALRREGARWVLEDEAGAPLGDFARVIVAAPAPQAAALLAEAAPALAAQAARATYDPCWALMVALDAPLTVSFDAARVRESPLAWIARDSAKPGRAPGERWVAHASPAWSREHLERDPDEVAPLLLAALAALVGPAALEGAASAHRWRYAQVAEALGEPCLYERALGLGACGDWCLGPRIEAAWRSGVAAAGRLLGHNQPGLAAASPGWLL